MFLSMQYVIYDFNSFVADCGGYMGLVLGIREFLDSMNLSTNSKLILFK